MVDLPDPGGRLGEPDGGHAARGSYLLRA